MKILLIRHALPLRVENHDGTRADPPLGEVGRDQAAKVARWLSRETIHAIYSSPMRRAVETARPLAETLALEIQLEQGIVEFDRDSPTYIPLEELKADDPEAWRTYLQNYRDAGLHEFGSTVVQSVEGIIAAHRGENVAIFCHGGVINAWACNVLGLEVSLFLDSGYTSVSRFLAASSGERSLSSLNETAHLRT